MKRFTSILASLAACMMLSQSAQAQLRVSSPNDNKKESAAIPHIKKSAPNFEVRHLAPAKASSSQQSVLIDEDFSLVTNGSETAPDTTRYLASQYPQFGDGIYIDPTLTKDGTWGGDWVMAAGGMLYLRTYNPQLPATLFTPMGDYSGDITISFRVKSVPYYIPSGTDESGNQKWAYYWGSSINVFAFKGGYESTERPNTDMNTYGESYRFYPTEGWQEIEVTFRNFEFRAKGGCTRAAASLPVPEVEKGYPDIHMFERHPLPAYGFYLRHADGITFENVRTGSLSAAEERPALAADDVTGIVQTASPSLSMRP